MMGGHSMRWLQLTYFQVSELCGPNVCCVNVGQLIIQTSNLKILVETNMKHEAGAIFMTSHNYGLTVAAISL